MWMRAQFDDIDRPLTPGLFVRVRFPIGHPYEAMLVAEQAVLTDQGQKYVYVVDDKNKVEYRRVKTGRLQGGLRVIRPYKEGTNGNDKEGLKPNEKIVVAGTQRARPDQPVNPKLVKMTDVVKVRVDDEAPLPPPKKAETGPMK
jgi:multidrug efflux pump subunit AcrA (membrane-fusion protein)